MKDADTIVLPRLTSTEVDVEDPWGEGHDMPPSRRPTPSGGGSPPGWYRHC
ncbi:hypothetical protein GA0074696_2830 [Micromonospora purpureochromogenes]|uniref:Uncharacterized protein n=1 Tax=Micromonospora purpureochromogenes TaxID=47872 RepID=A0A1C4XTE0_9ACTN|nr:hypothetical protein GA0074696_2830 [Micromonospora purpureochromogenes]